MASMKSTSLIAEMDSHIRRMLKLAEEDADTFAERAGMYYRKRPELIALVKDFYRMYRSLAERSDPDCRRRSSDLQSQCSGVTDAGSLPSSPGGTPDSANSWESELMNNYYSDGVKAQNYEEPEESIIDAVACDILDIDEAATAELMKYSIVIDLRDELRSIHAWRICNSFEEEGAKKKGEMKNEIITCKDEVIGDLMKKLQVVGNVQRESLAADLKTSNDMLRKELKSRDDEIEQLRAEKDDLMSSSDKEIHELNGEVLRLRVEHVHLAAAAAAAREARDELRRRMIEAEAEREAVIRQLRSSVGHYRNAYIMLRRFVGRTF